MALGCVVARIKPGSEKAVAEIFAESDASELPALARCRSRHVFIFEDVFVHVIDLEDEFADTMDRIRDHPLFRDVSTRVWEHVSPYNPETWSSPKDSQAVRIYSWEANERS